MQPQVSSKGELLNMIIEFWIRNLFILNDLSVYWNSLTTFFNGRLSRLDY